MYAGSHVHAIEVFDGFKNGKAWHWSTSPGAFSGNHVDNEFLQVLLSVGVFLYDERKKKKSRQT